MGERYEKGKSNGPQRQYIKNQTSNGRVSHFDAFRSTDEKEVPQDLNDVREAGIIFYKGEGGHLYITHE